MPQCVRAILLLAWLGSAALPALGAGGNSAPIVEAIAQVQPKMVKLYGAGGLQGLEAYQSALLISPQGHILTAWTYVLDTDYITAVLWDGRRLEAKLVGADPRLEIAVLKVEAADLPYFDLTKSVEADVGTRILAASNLFGVATGNEPVSVQHGTVAAKTHLQARRGVFETPYNGPVYVLDVVTNNPGAAGGALLTRRGELVGVLGKELRNALNNTWLNYAIPIQQLRSSVEQIRAGKFVAQRPEEAKKPSKSLNLAVLGLVLVPDVVDRTPPFVDEVIAGSPAAKAGLQPDDLVVLVGDRLIQSCKALSEELQYIDIEDKVRLTVVRGQDMKEYVLQVHPESKQ